MAAPDPQTALELSVDELGMLVLADLVATNEWNEYNHLDSASQDRRYLPRIDAALRALAEALTWLRNREFIARTPGQTAGAAIFVTRAGHAALKTGVDGVHAEQRLQDGLHPLLQQRCRRQFLLGSTSRLLSSR